MPKPHRHSSLVLEQDAPLVSPTFDQLLEASERFLAGLHCSMFGRSWSIQDSREGPAAVQWVASLVADVLAEVA